ncbi:MAG: ATP-binding protein [Cyanobacteriota bacterium]|nr:ATP-binding protein [Cyanobacteriota bacterium]
MNTQFTLGSTLEELTLYETSLESSSPGQEVNKVFKENPLLPGIIITENGKFLGMISRRRFFEYMSRPYSLELFSNRPLLILYRFAKSALLILDSNTTIVAGVRQCLLRSLELIYEPVVVKINQGDYKVLDSHQLLLAQLQIHEMTTSAMRESQSQLRQQAKQLENALQELQQTQVQLIQTEKMSSLGQLVAGVAHEINNPLSFILGNLPHAKEYIEGLIKMFDLYEKHYPEPQPEIEELAEEIELDYLIEDLPIALHSMEDGAQRIRQFVLSLRNFSRLDESQMKTVNIHEGLDNTLVMINSKLTEKDKFKGIATDKKYGDLPKIECYAGQLNQVFLNIMVNAIDALEEATVEREKHKKEVQITDFTPTITIETSVEKGFCVIKIADNGVGMMEDVRARIFDAFFTTKPVGYGTGLGLSIAREIIVKQHGGELECFSEPGKGSEFVISIPIKQFNIQPSLPRFP